MLHTKHFGDVTLQSGETLRDAFVVAATYGELSPAKDNAVVFPTWFGGDHSSNEWLIRADMALDPARWFVIVPNLIGNGTSISPSNSPAQGGGDFPKVTIADNVRLQQRLLAEDFGVARVALATGSSMGAIQAYHWAALFPAGVARLAPYVGAARVARHNRVMLAGLRAALTADAAWDGTRFTRRPDRGLAAFARVYAGWGFSQDFFREELDRAAGFTDLEDYMKRGWEEPLGQLDPHDILAMLWAWEHADISANERYRGDFDVALGAIEARTVVMPSATDLYFTVADSAREVAAMRDARLAVIPSLWGHYAGGPGVNPADAAFISDQIAALLAS